MVLSSSKLNFCLVVVIWLRSKIYLKCITSLHYGIGDIISIIQYELPLQCS